MSSLTNETAQPADSTSHSGQRLEIFLHSFAFVFGFGVVFTLLGSAAGLLGASLLQYQIILQKIGGVLLIVFGLATLGLFFKISEFLQKQFKDVQNRLVSAVIKICHFFNALLYTERRVKQMHEINPGWGYASSFAVGVSFSAGWVPCIGPILASILLLASNSATAKQGAALLAFYSLGLGIPFLITGLAFGRMTKLLRKMNRYLKIISIVSGLFMIAMGYILWTDQITVLITQFGYLNEIVFVVEEWVTGSLGNFGIKASNVDSTSAIPLAIFAGVISFISPCVLPLVPAYIGYLGGATLNK
ncbi:MAG: cytochrome c biogenesis protein CcdA [Anaerolineae bacterium]